MHLPTIIARLMRPRRKGTILPIDEHDQRLLERHRRKRAFLVEGRVHTAPPPPPAPPPCRYHKGRPIFRSEESRG